MTIQQGHNIKLLTLVSIFFLPLTFVTSVFGMTNMPTTPHYWVCYEHHALVITFADAPQLFGIVTATVCIPFFILIGSLNTTRGMHFWREKTAAFFHNFGRLLRWLFSCGRSGNDSEFENNIKQRFGETSGRLSLSQSVSMQNPRAGDIPLKRWSTQNCDTSTVSVEPKSVEPKDSESVRPALSRSQTSRIAEMWANERHRTVKYHPDV